MKRLSIAFALTILTASPLLSQPTDQVGLSTRLTKIEQHYPFPEGSPGEATLFDHIVETLEQNDISVERLDFADESDKHSFSQVVRARIDGATSERLAIAIPVSHPERASLSESGAPAIAAALFALEQLSTEPAEVTVEFLFLGAERGNEHPYPMGSNLLLERLDIELPDALVYFDIPGAAGWARVNDISEPVSNRGALYSHVFYEEPGSLVVLSGATGQVAPDWLARNARDSAVSAGIRAGIDDRATQLFRIGSAPQGRTFLVAPWLEADVPSVLVVDSESRYRKRIDGFDEPFEPLRETPREQRENATEALTAVFTSLFHSFPEGIPGIWDRHTIATDVGESRFVVGERRFLIGWLSLVGITMLYGIVFRRRLARYIRTIRRNFWTLPLLFGAAFLYLGVAGAIAEAILEFRAVPELWRHAPAATFVLKLTLAGALFQGTYLLVGRLPLSRNGSFYTAAALLIVFLSILLFAAVNIALSIYFLIAFLIVFLFSVSRWRFLKVFWLLVSVIPVLIPAIILFSLRAESLIELLIVHWQGNLLLAAAVLPLLLLVIRVGFLFSHPQKVHSPLVVRLVTVVLLLATAALAGRLLLFETFDETRPQIVRITDQRDRDTLERHISLESNGVLPEIVYNEYRYTPDEPVSEHVLEDVSPAGRLVNATVIDRSAFLGRTLYRIRIDSDRSIRSIDLRLASDQPLFLYNSNFPVSAIGDGRTQQLHVGRNPPSPLYVEIVIPDEQIAEIEYEAEFSGIAPTLPEGRRHTSVFSRIVERGSALISAPETDIAASGEN